MNQLISKQLQLYTSQTNTSWLFCCCGGWVSAWEEFHAGHDQQEHTVHITTFCDRGRVELQGPCWVLFTTTFKPPGGFRAAVDQCNQMQSLSVSGARLIWQDIQVANNWLDTTLKQVVNKLINFTDHNSKYQLHKPNEWGLMLLICFIAVLVH